MSRDAGQVVGALLKRHRSERALTLRGLAAASNVSAAMISQIEIGEKSPTIAVLSALAAGLGVPLSRLVEEPPQSARLRVVRAADVPRIEDPSGVVRETLAPPVAGSELEFVRLRFPAGSGATFAAHPGGTHERVVVAEGSVTLAAAGDEATLAAGDAATFDGAFEHRFTASEAAIVYLVVEPAS